MTSGRRGPTLRIELHMHTDYSFDSTTSLEDLEEKVLGCGTDWVAVTDHDTIEGALRLRDRGKVGVIVGEEVSTIDGDLIGLFLKEHVEAGFPPEETVAAIREQGGLVYVPHPFDRTRGSRLFRAALDECIDRIDILEVWNGRTAYREDNERAMRFAEEHDLVPAVGADAHTIEEVGHVWMETPPFHDAPTLLQALKQGHCLHPTGSWLDSIGMRIARLFGDGRGVPGG